MFFMFQIMQTDPEITYERPLFKRGIKSLRWYYDRFLLLYKFVNYHFDVMFLIYGFFSCE